MSAIISNTSMASYSGGGGANVVTVSTRDGNGIVAGDLIVAHAMCDGTHATNGMSFQDSVNLATFTHGKEQQLGGASAKWEQVDYYLAAANVPDGSSVTLTPYASNTFSAVAVTVVRFTTGTISNAFVSQGNTASTSQAAPALAAAPTLGNFVMTFDAAAAGTLTPGGVFTADSGAAGASGSLANAWAQADGVSTFASTWTDSASQVSAAMTVAFAYTGIGVPYRVGSAAQAAGSSSTVVSVTRTTTSGDALFCCIGTGAGSSVTPTGVTDTGSHTWTQIGAFAAANGMACYIYQSLNAASVLTNGVSTVTVAWSGTTYAKFVEVVACGGVNATVALDQTVTAFATSAAPAAGPTGTLGNANELVLGLITAGSASNGITWSTGITPLDSGLHTAGGVYFSAGAMVTGTTGGASEGGVLGTSAVWAELLITLLPAAPSGPAATITITNATPLPAGQVGVAFTDQLNATGGALPYKWDISAGTITPGLILEPGGGSGASGDFTLIGANTGPQGAPTIGAFNSAYPVLGPIGCYKTFHGALPAAWSGTLEDQITLAKPGTFIFIAWSSVLSATAISQFILSIPHSVAAVGFGFDSEPEKSGYTNGADFVGKYNDQSAKVRAAQASTPVKLYMFTASYTDHYQSTTDTSYLPPASSVDFYGMDFYDRAVHAAGPNMGSTVSWQRWSAAVAGRGKPLALTEFGISGYTTDATQNARLQADIAYLKGAFGPGGSVSQSPLFLALYWATGIVSGPGTIDDFQGPNTEATWKGLAGLQTGFGGGGGGGLLTGTPTTAAGSPFGFTARATDSVGATGTKAFTQIVTASNALSITTPPALQGGTTGAAYSFLMQAAGGTVPYSWSVISGSPPPGLSLAASGLITGTPTTGGTASFTIRVIDGAAAHVDLPVTLTVSSSLAVTTTSVVPGQANVAYGPVTLRTAGGTLPITWKLAAGAFPPGVTLDPDLGVLAGTPTVAGPFSVQLQATDAIGATALSPLMPLAISPAGGLPPIGRRRFGGTTGDWTFQFAGDAIDRAAGITVTFYDAEAGGVQVTDLTTLIGAPAASVVTDAAGEIPPFLGPVGVGVLWADANGGLGPRRQITAADAWDLLVAVYNVVAGLG